MSEHQLSEYQLTEYQLSEQERQLLSEIDEQVAKLIQQKQGAALMIIRQQKLDGVWTLSPGNAKLLKQQEG